MDSNRHQGFISYAWDDNLPSRLPGPDGSFRGWVEVFHDELTRLLVRALPRGLRRGRREGLLWIDYEQLRTGARITPEIRAQVAASPLLVPILSRAWFESPWCLDELEHFLSLSDERIARVFPVWREPVEPEDLEHMEDSRARRFFETLHENLEARFWYRDDANQVRTFWDPIPDPTEKDYLRRQQDLAREMANRLAALVPESKDGLALADSQVAGPTADAEAADAGQAARDSAAATDTAAEPAPEPIPGRHLVLVNGGTQDAERILAVAECLQRRHRLGVAVPVRSQPTQTRGLKPSEIKRDLARKLERCTAVLFVYRDGPAHQVDQQIDACQQAATEPRDDGGELPLDLCQYGDQPLLFVPPELAVHDLGPDQDCCEHFVALLRQRVQP